ncbi:hypothetical protein ACFOET_06105 [Parapedobacter deserti]|uniref:Uncharacterized protein n=1 Tax=Parapedobacter deserti TaxID=1912957 RepID=A0ABV7JJ04_9SPHI
MFNINSSFYKFLTALQGRLHTEFELKALSESICFLYAEDLPISVVYYLSGAERRVTVSNGTRCIHVDEDLWITKPDILLSRLAALGGQARRIHARNTVAARIDKPTALAFQEEHHLQVSLPGKYRYGLYHQGELVAAAVFSGGRKMEGKPENYRSYELLRFCHKQGLQVVGGFSKLLDAFEQEFMPGDIMTYADKDWSDGSSYRNTGFIIVGEIEPQVFWVDTRTMKRYYESTLPPDIANKSIEERRKRGYNPVYSAGSIKLVKSV